MMKKHSYDDSGNDLNRWILSYADLMTLLFAFFVVMYAMSSLNVSKYQRVMKSVDQAFQGKFAQALQRASQQDHAHQNEVVPISEVKPSENINQTLTNFKFLETAFQRIANQRVHVHSHKDWYELSIAADTLFKGNGTTIRENQRRGLYRIVKVLEKTVGPIAIEVYSDNQPRKLGWIQSNWSLTALRAAAVATFFDKFSEKKHAIAAIGYGDQYPMGDNLSAEGRAKNRRIMIVVAKDAGVSRLSNPMQSSGVRRIRAKPYVETIKIKTMKEIRTKSGGVKFMQSIKEIPKNHSAPSVTEESIKE